jgi:hypothetical protein
VREYTLREYAVPSARQGLTWVFGMGTGGSPAPLSPGNIHTREMPRITVTGVNERVRAALRPRFNPHFHALILEGGFDAQGLFYFLPIHDTTRLSECLRRRTIGLFLKLGLITQQFAETLLCWKHSGFSVDNSVRLDGGDHHARQALAQYIARAPLSLQKLTYDRPAATSFTTPPTIPTSSRTPACGAPLISSRT